MKNHHVLFCSFLFALLLCASAGAQSTSRPSEHRVRASITVISPNGGENWMLGSSYKISWTSRRVSGNVKIEINGNYPSGAWETVFASVANNGSASWTVTGVAGTAKRIRITSVNNTAVSDISNSNFTISAPQILVISPNGGENWQTGSSYPLTWNTGGVSGNVIIELNRNYPSGAWETLFASVPNSGSQSWTVSGAAGTANRIRVTSLANSAVADVSDNNFTISATASTMTIGIPNGNEIWFTSLNGSTHNITWTSNAGGNVKIELYKGGSLVSTIAASAPGTGTYSWALPTTITTGTDYKIKVTNISNPSVSDMSDANFTLSTGAFTWSGINWIAIEDYYGGQNCNFSKACVEVDGAGKLHLQIKKIGNNWFTGQINSAVGYGYGEYRFYLDTDINPLDPNTVIGLFSYGESGSWVKEIDVEIHAWNGPSGCESCGVGRRGNFIVQDVPGPNRCGNNMRTYDLPSGTPTTHKYVWTAGQVSFCSYPGQMAATPPNPTSSYVFPNAANGCSTAVPVPNGLLKCILNFWLFQGTPPVNQQNTEIVLSGVFVPGTSKSGEEFADAGTAGDETQDVVLYPNPANDRLNIRSRDDSNLIRTVAFYNLLGQELIFRNDINSANSEFDVSSLANGVYIVKIQTSAGMMNRKVSVHH